MRVDARGVKGMHNSVYSLPPNTGYMLEVVKIERFRVRFDTSW